MKCCDAMWNGVVHGECGGVLMQDGNVVVEVIPSDAEWFDAQLDMQNDGRNAVWDVWCGMECVLWVV